MAENYFVPLVGTGYHDFDEVEDQLFNGHAVVLVREPDNPFDQDAIAVDTIINGELKRLGYIAATFPGDAAKFLAAKLDAGNTYTTTIEFPGPECVLDNGHVLEMWAGVVVTPRH